jgi:hypothetical protein
MATYTEALRHMQSKPGNTAVHGGDWYRMRNGLIERGDERGNCCYVPQSPPSETLDSDKWELLEPF